MRRATVGCLVILALVLSGLPGQCLPDPVEWWMSKSDQYVWDWIPDLEVQGIAHGSGWGCPVCGMKIYEGRGHYPWIWDPDKPYKIECPICHRVFPTNDYHKWMLEGRKEKLDTTQPYVDDGNGYHGPDGVVYPFVKCAIGEGHKPSCWVWIFSHAVPKLAQKYAETGDEAYARRCTLILARIATEYPLLNPEHPKRPTLEQIKQMPFRRPPRGSKQAIGGYQVEGNTHLPHTLRAFRQLQPYLNKNGDGELRAFLAAKGIDDVKSLIQWDLCQEMIIGCLEGNFLHGLGFGRDMVLAQAALDWDLHDPSEGVTTEYILDWIVHSGPDPLDESLYNHFGRDGFGCCEGLGYNFGGIKMIKLLAEVLKQADIDLDERPRFQEIMRAPAKPVVAGEWYPSIGDGGGWRGSRGKPAEDITYESRNYAPFGLAIFESGERQYRRGVTCFYGGTTAHGHFDRLTFSLFNGRGAVTPDLGYPHMGFAERDGWDNNTCSHNTVVVDARKQVNREPGYLSLFTITPTAQALEVDGQVAYRGIVSKYNRTLIWVDVDEQNSYLVDVFRVVGGSQHDYSLHGTGSQVSVAGLELAAQEGGTLAGPEVEYLEYYDGPPAGYMGSGYQYLFNVEKGRPAGDFIATWNHSEEKTPFLRVHVPAAQAEEVLFADGLPPFGKPEDALRYMFLRNGTCPPLNQQLKADGSRAPAVGDLESTFVTVLEPLHDEPFIGHVERFSGTESQDVVLGIHRADGKVDTLICLEQPSTFNHEEISFEGRIGLYTRDGVGDGGPSRMVLLDGSSLAVGQSWLGVRGASEGSVSSVDYEAMTLTVPEKLPAGEKLAGKTIVFNTPPRTTSFVIDSVEEVEAGSRIKLRGVDAIAFRGKVEKADNGAATVILNSPISTLHAGTGLAGKRLYNEDHSLGVRIRNFERRWDPNSPWPPFGGTASVEAGQDLEQAFVDKDGDGLTIAYVYEFGPGDLYRIAPSAYLEQKQ